MPACKSLGDVRFYANMLGFWGSVPLLPHLCPLGIPEVGACPRKRLFRRCMGWVGGASGTVFFFEMGHYCGRFGFFWPVLVRF